MRNIIKNKIKDLILEKYNFEVWDFDLQNPPKKNMWDYTVWAFILSKKLWKKPQEVASELVSLLNWDDLFFDANESWPFVNFRVDRQNMTSEFRNIYSSKHHYGIPYSWEWESIYIDYIGANVWKPLHIWHMCTPLQGQAMINLYRYKLGYNVISDSHIWDWWIIFWKLIFAYKNWWNEEKLEENAVNHLLELYVKATKESEENPEYEDNFREEFKNLSLWKKESVSYWEKFTKGSINAMQKTLSRLWVNPDFNIWESFYEGIWLPKIENYPDLKFSMKDIVKELIEKWIATQNDDWSVWIEFPEDTKLPSCILQKRDWTHGYLASDLASVKYRMTNWPKLKKILYFVDVRQKLHFEQVFEISKMASWLDPLKTEISHCYNWFISLKDGALSTRKWNIIFLDKLIDEAENRAEKIILEKRQDLEKRELNSLSSKIWIWAIKYGYLNKNRTTDVVFDWDEFMTFEWNSGPYIQYAYTRAHKLCKDYTWDLFKFSDYNFEKDEEIELLKGIFEYEDVIEKTAKLNSPHILANYIYDLTKKFSSFYNAVRINWEAENIALARLQITDMFTVICRDGMEILWVEMPDRM